MKRGTAAERARETTAMDEEDYLGKNGYPEGSRPTASFMRSTKGMSDIALKRAKARHLKNLRDYDANRDRLRREYKAKVRSGELVPKGRSARLLKAAKGHPDTQTTQAARRILMKQGIWTDRMSRNADRQESVMTRGTIARRAREAAAVHERSTEGKDIENVSYAGNALMDVADDFERKVKALKRNKDIDQKAVQNLARYATKMTRIAREVAHEAEQFFFQNMPY